MQDQVIRRTEFGSNSKRTHSETGKHQESTITSSARSSDDKKTTDLTRSKPMFDDNKLAKLKQYRRTKGLCFKCGEKWNPQHKCPETISLHAMEELWQCLADSEELCTHDDDSESE